MRGAGHQVSNPLRRRERFLGGPRPTASAFPLPVRLLHVNETTQSHVGVMTWRGDTIYLLARRLSELFYFKTSACN